VKVKGQFMIYTNDWFEVIDGTEWNRCEGEPECDGQECFGVAVGDGLDFGTPVVVTNADGKKVGIGEIDQTWGWRRGATGGACTLYWSVPIPESEAGVLTVTIDDDPGKAIDFTLAEFAKKPGMLSLYGIGDLNS
jgi:hypothetical protein